MNFDKQSRIRTNLVLAAFFAVITITMAVAVKTLAPVELPQVAFDQELAIWQTWSGPGAVGAYSANQALTDEMFRINMAALDVVIATTPLRDLISQDEPCGSYQLDVPMPRSSTDLPLPTAFVSGEAALQS